MGQGLWYGAAAAQPGLACAASAYGGCRHGVCTDALMAGLCSQQRPTHAQRAACDCAHAQTAAASSLFEYAASLMHACSQQGATRRHQMLHQAGGDGSSKAKLHSKGGTVHLQGTRRCLAVCVAALATVCACSDAPAGSWCAARITGDRWDHLLQRGCWCQ